MAQTINTPVTRYEAPRKVSGETKYAADFMPAGMFFGELVVSSIARGRLTSIDIREALAEPGVITVYTHETIPKYETPKGFYAGGPGTSSFWPMTGTEIKYAGQPVAFVVAENAAAARRGARLVQAKYSVSRGRLEMDTAASFVPPSKKKGDCSALLNCSPRGLCQT
ncbi:hypothetical protein [Polaromonas glacialis]|uniref:hypothetical protein n=1 Tax=Polaromonas glacialis TaxID=866564 RepID=UPI000495A82F|nr:hypothetical protein [Polaromonas glacialis]